MSFKDFLQEAKEKYYLLTWYKDSNFEDSIGSKNIVSSKPIKEIEKEFKNNYKGGNLEISEIDSKEAKYYDFWENF